MLTTARLTSNFWVQIQIRNMEAYCIYHVFWHVREIHLLDISWCGKAFGTETSFLLLKQINSFFSWAAVFVLSVFIALFEYIYQLLHVYVTTDSIETCSLPLLCNCMFRNFGVFHHSSFCAFVFHANQL